MRLTGVVDVEEEIGLLGGHDTIFVKYTPQGPQIRTFKASAFYNFFNRKRLQPTHR
jgi:hypothetical protein